MSTIKAGYQNTGLIYLFTGDGKGKTSAALGMVLRASCLGHKIAWISWYKSPNWDIAEKKLPQKLTGVDYFLMGEGFYIKSRDAQQKSKTLITGGKVFDTASVEAHKKAATKALQKAQQLLQTQQYFLLICDEICNALHDGLLNFAQVQKFIALRGVTHLVLTGRNADTKLIETADLVSQISKSKHPFDKGISAVKGLDF